MVRALCVLAVACAVAVAAAAGTGHGEARAGALAAAVTREAPPSLGTAAVHPALHAVTVRTARPRGPRASHASLSPVALATAWSLAPLRRAMIAPSLPAGDRRADRPTRTGCARGPPIG